MRGSIALIGGLLVFATAAAVSQDVGRAAAVVPTASDTAAVSRGAKAWAENCGACHNLRSPGDLPDAQASVAVAHMRVRAKLPGDMARDILAFLQASNSGQMPAPASAPAVTARTGASPAPLALTAGDPARGNQVYKETCIACHGANGKGALPGVPDLTDPAGRLAKPDDVLLRNMIEGFQSPGSPMPMPARGGNPDLTDQGMADVLAYMRATFERR